MHYYESVLDTEDMSSTHWIEDHFCDEYWPVGRYDVELDEYGSEEPSEQSGIPDEVLGPRDKWIPLDLYTDCIAANWERTRIRPDACGSRQVTFSSVLEYRIRKHRKYARTVRDVLGLQLEALNEEKQEPRCVRIMGTLGVLEPREEEYHELSSWVNSSTVQIPWSEYYRHYTGLGMRTQNPLWPRVQWYLSNTNRDRRYSNWERLGFGQWQRPVSRRHWTHEDYACRFILRLYDMINDFPNREHTSVPDYLIAERAIGSRVAESYDDRDKSWFGYSLLCLLIRSWQYKQQHTCRCWTDNEQLIPALQADYQPGCNIRYPKVNVGAVCLSPFTPWIYEDDLPKNLDPSDIDSDDEEPQEPPKR